MIDDDGFEDDEAEPTADSVREKAERLIADLERFRAEYAALTEEERAALPESVIAFFEPPR